MAAPDASQANESVAGKADHTPMIRGLFVLLSGEGISRFLSFLAIALLARRLGDSGWAPVAVALTISQFGALFVESGMRLYGAREVARDPEAGNRLATGILSTQVAIAGLLVVVVLLAAALDALRPELAQLLPGYAVALLALPLFVPWIFQGLNRMEWVAVPQVVRFGSFLVLSAVVVTGPDRATMLPWIEVTSMSIGAAIALWAARRLGLRLPRRAAFDAGILRESVPIAASQLLWVARMYLPILVLWKLGTDESVARFDLSHRVLMVLQALLTMYLTNLFPSLAREAVQPGKRFVRLLLGSTALASLGAGLVAAALAVEAGSVLALLYSDVFAQPEAITSLALLGLVFPVLAIRGHGHYALVALNRQRIEFLCSLASTTLLVVLLLKWVPERVAVGSAYAMLVSESAGLVLTWCAVAWAATRGTAQLPAREPTPRG